MFIDIAGKSKFLDHDVIKKAILFYGEYLMGKRLANNLDVTVKFQNLRHTNDFAYCDWMDDNHMTREFLITIDKSLNKKDTLLTLGHEMVHVKQYAKGEMKDYCRPPRMVRWKGQKFCMEDVDYWSLPWEREARGYEMELYMKFREKMKENNVCF